METLIAILFGAVITLFVVGIVRSIRRRRK